MVRVSLSLLGLTTILSGTAVGTATTCSSLCKALESQLPGQVSYPESTSYNESISSYYSGQEKDLEPGCIFAPKDASEVSKFIKLATAGGSRIQFAIRSGGHTIWKGAANIDGGITVDLRLMNSVMLSADQKVASIGGGGIWSEIYPQLVPYNLTVMGGRVSGIGVGGFSTGGGINFLSRRHGFACDNIYGYEVVLASGEIVYATASSYSDLWLALKGGSNNFGIVTRFDVPTFPLGTMLGGSLSFNYTTATLDAHAKAFSQFMDPQNFDDAADMGVALVFISGGIYALGDSLFYVKPIEDPPVYQPFTSIPGLVQNGLKLADVGEIVLDSPGVLSPDASRAIDIVYSFKNADAALYSELFQTWEDGTKALPDIEGLQLVLLIQTHPVTNGTNSLGLPPGEKDLVMSVLTAAYTNAADDEAVQKGMQDIIDKHVEVLTKQGLYIPFQYLNYADSSQDPIAGYGPEVKTRLQAVSKKYDPHGVFQSMVPGGFKLFK
ncbi:oxidoreductase FAD-binding protein [Thozetella sp. PMI_491]|nr:oxidoreductase FAD-binding protein [Thozetella sp. PMI_491]